MGTTVAPRSSSIAGSITSYGKSGAGMLGGTLVDLGSVYNSLSDSGGVMAAANDRNNGNIGAGVTDNIDPSKAPKKDISASKLDAVIKRADEIRNADMSDEDKRIALSELLTAEGIPHDPASLDPRYGNTDKFGLISKRVNVIDDTSSAAASADSASSGGAISSTDAIQGAVGGLESLISDAAAADEVAEFADLTEDTTASTITGGDGSLGDAAVSDVNEEWTYDKATDSFISSTRGDRIPNRGNADLRDGAVYTVTPVIGTDGVTAEHVVDTETNESVGIFNIDINTGLPSITKSVDTGSTIGDTDTFGTARDTMNTGETLTVGDKGNGDLGNGDDFNTARDTNNTGTTLTVGDKTATGTSTATTDDNGDTTGTSTGTGTETGTVTETGTGTGDTGNGIGGGGGSGRNIGLFQSIQNTPITESILFEPKFTKLENVQQGMFEAFLRAAGGNR